jgi:VCBS repeat-containing protein
VEVGDYAVSDNDDRTIQYVKVSDDLTLKVSVDTCDLIEGYSEDVTVTVVGVIVRRAELRSFF